MEHWRIRAFRPFIRISESEGLEALVEECKELENLNFTKCWFFDLDTKEEVEAKFPNCNVEFKNCKFGPNWDDSNNSKSDNDGDVLDNFEGGELELMFTIKDENVSLLQIQY